MSVIMHIDVERCRALGVQLCAREHRAAWHLVADGDS